MWLNRVLFFLLVALCPVLNPVLAFGACNNGTEVQVWESGIRDLHYPVRIEVAKTCGYGSQVLAQENTNLWTVRVWSRCYPKDCKWGRVFAREGRSGRYTAIFKTFSAVRTVEFVQEGTRLRVSYNIDYYAKSQRDLRGEMVMSRVD